MDENKKTVDGLSAFREQVQFLERQKRLASDIKRELIERDIEWARLLDERTRILGSYADHHDEAIKESDARKATKERDLYTRMRALRLEASTQLDEVIRQRDTANAKVCQLEIDVKEFKALLDRVESERVEIECRLRQTEGECAEFMMECHVWKTSYESEAQEKALLQRRLNDLGYQRQIEPMLEDVIRERDEWKAKYEALQAEKHIPAAEVLATVWLLCAKTGGATLEIDVVANLQEVYPDVGIGEIRAAMLMAEALGWIEQAGDHIRLIKEETKPKRKCTGITCRCGMGDAPCTGEAESPHRKDPRIPDDGDVMTVDDARTQLRSVFLDAAEKGTLAPDVISSGLPEVKIKLLRPSATLPERQTDGAVGYDVFADLGDLRFDWIGLSPGESELLPLGFAVEIPIGYEMQIRPRSGLARDKGVTIMNSIGTVDQDYRGEVMVLLVNHSRAYCVIKHGDRIAQAVFAPVETPELVTVGELSKTERGGGGFGSTDKGGSKCG